MTTVIFKSVVYVDVCEKIFLTILFPPVFVIYIANHKKNISNEDFFTNNKCNYMLDYRNGHSTYLIKHV